MSLLYRQSRPEIASRGGYDDSMLALCSLLAMMTETPVAGRAFVDSVGVDVHLHHNGTAYYDRFPTIEARLVQAHIRHVREGMIDTTWQPFYARLNELGAAGIHSTLVTNEKLPVATVVAYPQRVAASIEAIEAPNEADNNAPPGWAPPLVSYVKELYRAVKSDPATSRYPVIGPSLTTAAAYGAVGDLAAFMDEGNVHDYFNGFAPGNGGYGGAGFGSYYGTIDYDLNVERQAGGAKPIVSTETGYGTAPATHTNVSEAVQAKYLPRLLLLHYQHGIRRTFLYQLADSGTDGFGAFGILHADASPKPSYTAIASLLTVLDQAGAPKTEPLGYDLTGAPGLAHELFQRPDGTYVLAFWQEVSSWNVNAPNGGTPIDVPPVAVTLTLPRGADRIVTYRPRPNGSFESHALPNGTTIALSATDGVALVVFRAAR